MSSSAAGRADYDSYWRLLRDSAKYHPGNRYRYALIAKHFKDLVKPGDRVLDIGCGEGSLLARLYRESPTSTYFGVDVSTDAIALDRLTLPQLNFLVGDATDSRFGTEIVEQAGGAFDFVILCEVIEHVIDDRTLLRNVAALLKPGGILILTTQSGPRFRVEKELLKHIRHYDRNEIQASLHAADMTTIQAFNCGFAVLTAQKIVTSVFFRSVVKFAASGSKPPPLIRGAMTLLFLLLRAIPIKRGPQLFVLATRR